MSIIAAFFVGMIVLFLLATILGLMMEFPELIAGVVFLFLWVIISVPIGYFVMGLFK
jgi:hypothetical protein